MFVYENLNHDNFLIYAAKHYDNPQCHTTEEFIEDLRRIKYIKKLITRYIETGDLKERLILNHLIILSNVYKADILVRILFLKMRNEFKYIKPFLILLNLLPEKIFNIGKEQLVHTDMIPMDQTIVEVLRKI
jgi:hypothetical protein